MNTISDRAEEELGAEACVSHVLERNETRNTVPIVSVLRRNFRKLLLITAFIAAGIALCGIAKKAKAETNFSLEQIAQLDLSGPENIAEEKKEKTPEELFRVFLRAPDETEMALSRINVPFDTQGWFLIAECDKEVPDNECVGETERGQLQTCEKIEVINSDGARKIRRLIIFSLDQVKDIKDINVTFGKGEKALRIKVPVYAPKPALEPPGPAKADQLPLPRPEEAQPPKEKELVLEEEVVELEPEHPEHQPGVIGDLIDKALKDPAHKRNFLRVTAGLDVTAFTNDPDKKSGAVAGRIGGELLWNTGNLTRLGVGGNFSYSGIEHGIGDPEAVEITDSNPIHGRELCFGAGPVIEKAFPLGGHWRGGVSGELDFEGCLRNFDGKENVGVSRKDRRQMIDASRARRFVSGLRASAGLFAEHAKGFFARVGISPKINLTPVQKDASSDAEEGTAGSVDAGASMGYQF